MKYAFVVCEDINLGCGYVMSYLKKEGHDVKLFFDPRQFARGYSRNGILARLFDTSETLVKRLKKFQPDVACFAPVTATYQWALQMAEKIKQETECKVIFGGVHATLVPEEVRKHDFIDEVVEGDGISYFGGEFAPDKIWPEREMFLKELPPAHRKTQLFMTSFGCPYNCSFCGNEQLRKVGKFKIKRRSVEGCIDELIHIKSSGAERILFVDDIFTVDKNWLFSFLDSYTRDVNLPFSCFIHPMAIDARISQRLKEAGCETAWMGIQTGNEQLRKEILNRHETNDDIIKAAKCIKDAGIKLMVDHIFGIPFESNSTQDISYSLYNHIRPDVVNCYELLYFPKAKIIDHAIKFGYLNFEDKRKIERGEGVVYQTGNKGHYFYDTYVKAMCAIPLRGKLVMLWELLPLNIIKLIVHIRAGRAWMFWVIVQNELFFTWRAILKKVGLWKT